MADSGLASLRAEALLHAAVIGGVLAAVLGIATIAGHLTAAQSLTALAFYLGLAGVMVGTLAAHLPQRRFGAANALTLARGAAVVTLAGFLAGPLDTGLLWVASVLAFLCIALDGVDGFLARRFATDSPFGARFDMEVDALLMLVLGLLIVAAGTLGVWVLLIGAARYLFVAAGFLLPALRANLPYSERRRAVCVFQGLALVLALIPDLPPFVASHAAAAALLATIWSFGIDIRYLLRAPAPAAD
jgi:phosphatidylglycerophosphate synthase